MLELGLLAMIAEKPRYGFEMIQRLDERRLLNVGEGSVYPCLSRMQNEGLVSGFVTTAGARGRKRKYYQLTDDGARALGRYARDWQRFKEDVDALLEESAR